MYEITESCSCHLVEHFLTDSGAAVKEGRIHFVVDLKECPTVEEQLMQAFESLAKQIQEGKGCLFLTQAKEKIVRGQFPQNIKQAENLREAIRKIRIKLSRL